MAKLSVQQRWDSATAKAQDAIQDLIDIQGEYQEKFDGMSEKSQQSEKGESYAELLDFDLQEIMDNIQEAASIALPE